MPQAVDQKKYAKLLSAVLPQPITSDRQHKDLLAVTSQLMKKEQTTAEENALLALLGLLISDYERTRYADLFEKMTPNEALAFLFEENHLTQRDFPEVSQSRISEILGGKRKISKAQAVVFGRRFKVSPALFLSDPDDPVAGTARR